MAKGFKFKLGQSVRMLDAVPAMVTAQCRELDGSKAYFVAAIAFEKGIVRHYVREFELSPVEGASS